MSLHTVSHLSTILRGQNVLSDISFNVGSREFIGLIGPNGAGKTTLMRSVLGLLPHQGDSSLAQLTPAARAREVAWMPQTREVAWAVTVEALIELGRLPHLRTGQRPGAADRAAVEEAIAEMGLEELRNRNARALSGGEQARVLIARALAQDTPMLMADEPIAGLDPAHQIATMQRFAALASSGRAVMASLHDLGLVARYCTRLLVVNGGRIVADGKPEEVLTPALIRETFGITAWFEHTEQGVVFQPLELVGEHCQVVGA